jgi:hypothetical protein
LKQGSDVIADSEVFSTSWTKRLRHKFRQQK